MRKTANYHHYRKDIQNDVHDDVVQLRN